MGEMGANLAADLGNILCDPAFGDVALVTQDNDRIFACRFILGARCEVFHSMLMHDTKSSEMSLPSITTSALLPTLDFIYTGRLSKHGITIDNVIDVLHASRFFLLTHLHQLALSFFSSQSLDQLCPHRGRLLSRAVEILSPEADIDIFSPLLSIMTDSLLDIDNVGEVSCEALQFYLKQTRIVGIGISTYDYIRLRYVLIWCAHSVSVEVDEALRNCMPAQPIEPFISSGSLEQKVEDCSLLSVLNPIESLFKASFEPWLHYLDLFWVHPQILARVVEPMGIIPLIHLLNVFRFQAMFSNEMLLLRWKEGSHHPSYVILEGGCVLQREVNDSLLGFAMTEAPVTSSTGIYEWDVVVERSCPYVGIGFCSTQAMAYVGSHTGWLGDMSFGWAFWSNGNLQGNRSKIRYAQGFGEGDRVRVHVDLSKGTCSFTVNEAKCGVAWNNIPSKIYPAVSMQFPGRVRIEAALNKDKLRWLKQFE